MYAFLIGLLSLKFGGIVLSLQQLDILMNIVFFSYARLRTGGVKVMIHSSTLTTWDVGITSLRYDHHTLCLLVSTRLLKVEMLENFAEVQYVCALQQSPVNADAWYEYDCSLGYHEYS